MDNKGLVMDNLVKHVQPLSRRYPSALPVSNIGFAPGKRALVDHPFATFNVSFILAGSGFYRFRDRRWRIEAPCAITQWPGIHVTYGPDDTWDELYVIYDEACLASWRTMGVARESRPMWRIDSAAPIMRRSEELARLVDSPSLPQHIDEVDRLCEMMIVTSLLARPVKRQAAPRRAVDSARAHVDAHFAEPIVWEVLAGSHGMSLATFRRHWAKHVSVPPGEYLTRIRIRRARELLVETDLPVGQIGREVGYDDELYFSRRFRQVTGTTATQYRRQHARPGHAVD
jgi:AraC-like DNA-binding protein